MVVINHLPPLIMIQLPLIHHITSKSSLNTSMERREGIRRMKQKTSSRANKQPIPEVTEQRD